MVAEVNCSCLVDGECICSRNLCDCDCECALCQAVGKSDNQQSLCACGNESCECGGA